MGSAAGRPPIRWAAGSGLHATPPAAMSGDRGRHAGRPPRRCIAAGRDVEAGARAFIVRS
jgi:hypothetical protein